VNTEVWIALVVGSGGVLATVRHIVTEWRASRREQFEAQRAVAEAQRAVADEMFEMRVMRSAQIERDRRRDNRRKREASVPPPIPSVTGRRTPQAVPIVRATDFETEETTDMHELIELQRSSLSPSRSSIRPPRPGTHHDGKD
jgi:hypothetical protein